MKTTPVSNRMYSLLVLFDMHSGFYNKAIDGISDDDANNRLNTKANHIAWLAGSLLHERYEMARKFGIDQKHAAHELFSDHKGIQDAINYPSLDSYKQDWETISPLLRNALSNISDEKLDSSFEMMPGMTMTHFDLISFMTYREANCIGQIALWRRLLGYEALKYD